MMVDLDRLFQLTANGTTVRTEILAGVTTFLTMAYIIFVQPAILSGTLFGIQTGMDFGAVMTATCVSAATGTVIGACCGTSTVTSFIESAAGVDQGGRTGLVGLVVAALFLLALFFSPIVAMIGSYAPITAPALVVVGFMMMQNLRKIDWNDYSEAVPAFLIALGIPLAYSIADGLAFGFITYPIIKALSGRTRDIRWPMVVVCVILLMYFVMIRS